MEIEQIVNILSEFSNLGIEELQAEITACTEEIDKINNEMNWKLFLLQALEEELAELELIVESLSAVSENLDVELIRAKTLRKKLTKNIGKLKSLNATNVRIEVGENDKLKLAKNKTKLDLMKKLLKIFVNSEDKGFVINPVDTQMETFQLNPNKSRNDNREVLWKSIGKVSRLNQQWEQLFE